MTMKRWYYVCSLIPFLMPVILFVIGVVASIFSSEDPGMLILKFMSPALFLLLAGGAQYFLLLLWFWYWSWDKAADEMREMAKFLPIIYVPVCLAGLFVYTVFDSSRDFLQIKSVYDFLSLVAILIPMSMIILIPSYLCVGMASLLTKLVTKLGWVKE